MTKRTSSKPTFMMINPHEILPLRAGKKEINVKRKIPIWRVSPVPFEQMDEGMRAIVRASDEALGGSEWIQAFAHAPDIYKPFVRFYYEYIMTDRAGISLKLTELVRHVVAEKNQCQL